MMDDLIILCRRFKSIYPPVCGNFLRAVSFLRLKYSAMIVEK